MTPVAPLNRFLEHARIQVPLVCGAMYPCSNPELVAAVSEAGGIGIIQPLSMVYVHRHDFREGMKLIKRLTAKPVGMNVIVEKSSQVYQERMQAWVDIALEEGVRFFVTSLGNPRWVVEKAHAVGGVVYHDVTERKWAEKALAEGVDGLIAVNDQAGGHAGTLSPQLLLEDLADLGVPVLGAGGVGSPEAFVDMLKMGYAGVQMGTRFIATEECRAHADYKAAIIRAQAEDIVLTERITGVPVSVIATPYIRRIGTQAGPVARMLLKNRKTKHWMRTFYTLMAAWKLKEASLKGGSYLDYFQAGRSVAGIKEVEPAGDVVRAFARAAGFAQDPPGPEGGTGHEEESAW
jgi:nitronate monooxygenase